MSYMPQIKSDVHLTPDKVWHLIKEKIYKPNEILALTFTNKAATEMKERIKESINCDGVNVGTFHSIGARILRRHIGYLNEKYNNDFTIYDVSDQKALLKEVVEQLNIAEFKELNINLEFSQSNIEGEIVTTIQKSKSKFDGIIINAAGFTHTSVAIRDALDIYKKPIIELHISNIYKREEFRHKSLISDIATGGIFGLGVEGYILAIISIEKILKNENR